MRRVLRKRKRSGANWPSHKKGAGVSSRAHGEKLCRVGNVSADQLILPGKADGIVQIIRAPGQRPRYDPRRRRVAAPSAGSAPCGQGQGRRPGFKGRRPRNDGETCTKSEEVWGAGWTTPASTASCRPRRKSSRRCRRAALPRWSPRPREKILATAAQRLKLYARQAMDRGMIVDAAERMLLGRKHSFSTAGRG